ncbi:MAG: hypothetical protein K9J06_14045 [Flavobacteriales bacterium]|nr:hypothetical protein [Flavobacteriales bacterium]
MATDVCAAMQPPLEELSKIVTYVGSPEHKRSPSFAGHPRPRADASICPKELLEQQDRINGWLSFAVNKGSISEEFEGRFPKYVWHKDGDQVFEARLVNRELGTYKGFPLNPDEWPTGIEELYP